MKEALYSEVSRGENEIHSDSDPDPSFPFYSYSFGLCSTTNREKPPAVITSTLDGIKEILKEVRK